MKTFKFLIFLLSITSVASAQSYHIDWYVIASGGGHETLTNYRADVTTIIGEPSRSIYLTKTSIFVNIR